jgi:hypothetical protein
LLTDNDEDSAQNLTIKELATERLVLKRELSRFDRLWERERKRAIDRTAKIPLKPLYDRYNRVCELLRERIPDSTEQEPTTPTTPVKSHTSTPAFKGESSRFISPKSPLYKKMTPRRVDSFDSAESLKKLIRRNNSSDIQAYVDTSFRNPTFVARKSHFMVSPMSPEDQSGQSSERSSLILRKLKERQSYQLTKSQKDALKKKLHQFQDDFIRKNGRKVINKGDKKPVETEYEEYKRLKRLLKDKEREVEREVDKLLLSGGTTITTA